MATHQQRDDGGLDQDGAKKRRFRIRYVGGLTALKEWSRPTTNRDGEKRLYHPPFAIRGDQGGGGGHSWKFSEPVSEARSGWLRCPHVLTTVPSFYGDLVLAVIAREQVCGVCAFPVRQLLLIWGGKMNLH